MQEVPAVGDVRSAGGTLRQSFPVDVRAVPGRYLHLHAGMVLEPAHEALLGALRQEIHDLMLFEVYEDGAVRGALLEGEVVYAQNPHIPDLRQGRGLDPPQQRVARGYDAQLQGESRSRPAAELEGDRQQSFLQPHGFAGSGGDVGQPLAEDLSLAGRLVAEEAPCSDLELDRDAVPGQVGDGAKVAAVHPRGAATAERANAAPRAGSHADAHAPGLDAEAFEVQALRQQFVGCDRGPHGGTTPYPARRSLTVRPIHHERDRTRGYWRGLQGEHRVPNGFAENCRNRAAKKRCLRLLSDVF